MAFGAYTTDLKTLPLPSSHAFLSWPSYAADFRIAQALSLEPDVTIYISNVLGSPGNDGLSEDEPLSVTQSSLDTLISTLLGNNQTFEFKFRRGETYYLYFKNSASVAGGYRVTAWGTGAKPIFSAWSQSGYAASDNAWTQDSGDVYYKTTDPVTQIGWIREVDDRFNPYTYVLSASRVAEVPHSWHQEYTTGTFTAATNDIITSAGHGLSVGDRVDFITTGTLPAGIGLKHRTFYIISDSFTTDQFKVSTESGGSAVDITSTGSGTHTWRTPSTLYINCGGDDPNDLDMEVVLDKNEEESGVHVTNGTGTGTSSHYFENIESDGWGISFENEGNNGRYGFKMDYGNKTIYAFVNCEAYYCGRHVFGMTANGGIHVTKGCIAGYGSIDNTHWVTYGDDEVEGIHVDGIVRFGRVPNENYTTVATGGKALYAGNFDVGGGANVYAHTSGDPEKIGLFIGWNFEFQDNRATYPRATAPTQGMSGGNLPGDYADLSTLRVFFNWKEFDRLVFHDDMTVTADASADTLTSSNHGYSNGDLVQITTGGSIPGGITQGRWYGIVEKTTNTYKLLPGSSGVSSVEVSKDRVKVNHAHLLSTDQRVLIRPLWNGEVPGGLDPDTLYYAVIPTQTCTFDNDGGNLRLNATSHGILEGETVRITNSGGALPTGVSAFSSYYARNVTANTMNLSTTPSGSLVSYTNAGTGTHSVNQAQAISFSETQGGPTVTLTDAGWGDMMCLYGTLVNISSTGSGTHTARCVDIGNSGHISQTDTCPNAVYINVKQRGLQRTSYGGVGTPECFVFNGMVEQLNVEIVTTALWDGDSPKHFNCHTITMPTGSFNRYRPNNPSSTDAVLFNSIVDNQGATGMNIGGATSLAANDTDHLRGTGYFDTYASIDSLVSNDDYNVNLTEPTSLGMAIPPTHDLYKAGYPSPGGIDLEYDYYGRKRDVLAPNIGPIDNNGEGGYRRMGNAPLVLKKGRLGNA